jgi:Ras-related protein Rab-8A
MRFPFNPDIKPTTGYEMSCREYYYKSKKYELNFLDSFGEERYPQIMKAFFKGASGSIILVDLNNPKSFEELSIYLNQIQEFLLEPCSAILVGNKKDQNRLIKKEEVEAIIYEQRLPYIECSALTNEGVDLILPTLMRGKIV